MKRFTTALLVSFVITAAFGQNIESKINYQLAFDELHQMLKGDKPISFKRAVFITENAYVGNILSYDDFVFQIDALAKLTKAVAATDGLDYNKRDRDKVLLAGSIYRVMKDSLTFESPDKQIRFRNVPFAYDMEDFWGENDWTKMFVTKLLYEQTGNCHSLPALYKIVADELGVDAWLALAPGHTYIKQWSDKTGWYNTELTTGRFPFDAEIKYNSYIRTEAIAAGVYMDTLSDKETIAYVMTDLAQGYARLSNYSDITTPVRWLDTALLYYPDYPNAMLVRAELLKKEYEQAMKDRGLADFRGLWKDASMKTKFDDLTKSYYAIHQAGYRRMPKQMYLNWLFRVRNDTTYTPYKFSSPQPFKQYNYNVQMLTAGDGENYEFFDQEEVVRIGTVEINRLTGNIIRFVKPEKDDLPDEVISRMYDPALGRFWQMDPKAEKRYWVNPYNFVQNNPVNRVDPTGLTDFALNKNTGAVTQVGDANNDPDRIVKTDKNGNVKRKGDGFLGFLVRESKRGEAKVAVGGIEKGILQDGQNFRTENNIFQVGGEGQPTQRGVEAFALKLSNYLGKEIKGSYFGQGEETSHMTIGQYQFNDHKRSVSAGHQLGLSQGLNLTGFFHTHPGNGHDISNSDRLVPSDQDLDSRDAALQHNPSLRFIIITEPENYGEEYPKRIPYTTGFSRRLR